MMYGELNAARFAIALPELTDDFVCEFCDMPQDAPGIFIDANNAETQSTPEISIRHGIRINSALRILRDHVKIALLHEMIHVSGISGHWEPFNLEVSRLMLAGTYNDLESISSGSIDGTYAGSYAFTACSGEVRHRSLERADLGL
jgi:hypothetical protein